MSHITFIEETGSTNKALRERMATGQVEEGSVVVAGFQTAGRGQVGNVWESEAGKNLTFSVVLYPETVPANRQFVLSQLAALSVKEVLDAYTDHITVKWPNDIYWKDKKICGMLIENDLCGKNIYATIIGIGINLNQLEFRSDAPNPVSLAQITGSVYDADDVLDRFLSILYKWYLRLLKGEEDVIRNKYREALYRRDGYFPFSDDDGEFAARIYDIEPTGHLVLQLQDGTLRRYAFKEVRYCK